MKKIVWACRQFLMKKTGNYIIEGFEVFVKRFGVEKIPEEFFSKGGVKNGDEF